MKKLIFLLVSLSGMLSMSASDQIIHHLWVDNSHNYITYNGNNLSTQVDMSSLDDGLHVLGHIAILPDATLTPPMLSYFYKCVSLSEENTIDYYALIDNDISKKTECTCVNGIIHLDMDMSEISEGFHQISVQLVPKGSSTIISSNTSYFIKTALTGNGQGIDCYAIVDNNSSKKYNCSLTEGGLIHVDLDMTEISDGLHQLTVYLNPEGSSTILSPCSSYFIKSPIGGSKIVRYCYWMNNDTDNKKIIDVETPVSPYNILGLLDTEIYPLRSCSYDFGIDGDDVIMTARHDFNLWSMDNSGRFSQTMTQSYSDPRTQRRIPSKDIEQLTSCHQKPVGTINDNEIKWYKFDAEIGDSLAMCVTQSAMYELYSPSGKKIFAKKGASAQGVSTTTIMETGVYHLALHDIASNDKSGLKLNFNHIPRNAILSVTPSELQSISGFNNFELFGNGMFDAKKLIIENEQGQIFKVDSLFPIDNYHLNASIFYEKPLPVGKYKLSMVVIDDESNMEKIISYPKEITISEKIDKSKIEIRTIPSQKASTPYMVEIHITNNSDVPCWGIPFNVACERDNGKNGFVFYMKDFFGEEVSLNNFTWYQSDNLLGTGKDGLYFPMVLDYMQPYETRVLKVGIVAEPHKKVGLYAWSGEPYNEAAERLLSMSTDSLDSIQISQTNLFNLETLSYMMYVCDELLENHNSHKIKNKANSNDNDWVLEGLKELGPDAIGMYPPVNRSASLASYIASTYIEAGYCFGGISNCLANWQQFKLLNDEGIPGRTIKEKVNYIYDHNMQDNAGIAQRLMIIESNIARSKSPEAIMRDIGETVIGEVVDIPFWAKVALFFAERNAPEPYPMPIRHEFEVLMSYDPNMMTGPTDLVGGTYIGKDIETVQYTIEFENDPELATAAASFVSVENKLDPKVFDLSTFKGINLEIGNRTINLPSEQNFVMTVDMRPEIKCIVEIRQNYSTETGEIKWTFNSLDPLTLEPVVNHLQGFLPVNNEKGDGIGTITYSVNLRKGIEHETQFGNSAEIIFDDNAPIITPEWSNIIDSKEPVAMITDINIVDNCYEFEIAATDEGSGIYFYDLHLRSENYQDWRVVMCQQTDRIIHYKLPEGIINPEFMVLATDRAGNHQSEIVTKYLLGDADSSGKVDATDIVLICNYYVDNMYTINRNNADVTKDGVIDIQDAQAALRIYLNSDSEKISKKPIKRYKRK